MSISIEPDWVLNRTEALQKHLRSMAALRGAVPRYGNRMLRLSTQRFDRYYMQSPDDGWIGIRDWALHWVKSDQGEWALDNIANICVDGVIDIPGDAVLVSIYARVDDSMAVEHAMRWG